MNSRKKIITINIFSLTILLFTVFSSIKITKGILYTEGFEDDFPSDWNYATPNLWSIEDVSSGEVHDGSSSLKLAGIGGLEFEGVQIPINFSNGSIEAWIYPEGSNTKEPTLYLRTSTNDGNGSIGYMTIKSGYGIRIYRDYATLIRVTDYERYGLCDINISLIRNQWWHLKLEIESNDLRAWVTQSLTFSTTPDLSYDISDDIKKYDSGKPAISGTATIGPSYPTFFDSIIVDYTLDVPDLSSDSISYEYSFIDNFDNLTNWKNSTNAPYTIEGLMISNNGQISLSSHGTVGQELVVNGDFEADPVGILNPKDTLTNWKITGDNGGTYSIETGKCLNMTNADGTNDYGGYAQNVTSGYNESINYIASGSMRLILDGTSYTQLMAVMYRFEDSSNSILCQISFFICETVTGYVNDSQYLWFDYSPFSGDSPSWVTNPDTGWINFNQNLTECLELLPNLDTVTERESIDHLTIIVEEYTNSIEQTQALFDNVSLTTSPKSPSIIASDLHGPAVYRNVSMGDFRIEITPKCQATPFGRGALALGFYTDVSDSGVLLWHFQWGDLWYNEPNSWGNMWLWDQSNNLLWGDGPSTIIGSWDDSGDNMTIIRSNSTLKLYIDGNVEFYDTTQSTTSIESVVIQLCQWRDQPICDDLGLDRIKIEYNNPESSSTPNLPVNSIILLLLGICCAIGCGLLITNSIKKRRKEKVLIKSTISSKRQYDSLIGEIQSDLPSKTQDKTPAPHKILSLSDIESTTSAINQISSAKKVNNIKTEKLENKTTPVLVILIAPLFWIIAQILFPPQLRKLTINKVHDNPLRKQIIDILHEREFEHFLTLKRKVKCGNALLAWHLQVLEDFDLIRRKKFGRAQVFYLKGSFIDEFKLKIYCSIRNKTTLMMLALFSDEETGIWDISLLSKRLNKSQRVVKYHCEKLVSLELLERLDQDNQYRLLKIRRVLIKWLIEKHS